VVTVVILAGGQPDYRCLEATGVLINETGNVSSSVKCQVHTANNATAPCTRWEYFGDIGHTIVSQVKSGTCDHVTIMCKVFRLSDQILTIIHGLISVAVGLLLINLFCIKFVCVF